MRETGCWLTKRMILSKKRRERTGNKKWFVSIKRFDLTKCLVSFVMWNRHFFLNRYICFTLQKGFKWSSFQESNDFCSLPSSLWVSVLFRLCFLPFPTSTFIISSLVSNPIFFPILSPFTFLFFLHSFFRFPFFPCHFVPSNNSYGLWWNPMPVKGNESEHVSITWSFTFTSSTFVLEFFLFPFFLVALLSTHWFFDSDHQSASSNSYWIQLSLVLMLQFYAIACI